MTKGIPNIRERLAESEARLRNVEHTTSEIHGEVRRLAELLRGNGEDGIIGELKLHHERIESLRSQWRWIVGMILGALFLAVGQALFTGCAWTTTSPVSYGDRETEGVRVYDPKPLLVVTERSTGIVLVPNFERGYAIRFQAFLAKNSLSLKTDEGVLTAFTSEVDTTPFLTSLLSLGQEALEQARYLGALGETVTGSIREMEGVYQFVFSANGELLGLRRIEETPLVRESTPGDTQAREVKEALDEALEIWRRRHPPGGSQAP